MRVPSSPCVSLTLLSALLVSGVCLGDVSALAPRQNVRVNDPSLDELGHTNSGPSVAVRGQRVLVGFTDAAETTTGYGFSTDGGATFAHRRMPTPASGYAYGNALVAFGVDQAAYGAMRIVNGYGEPSIGVTYSTDGGATFTDGTDAAFDVSNTQDVQDEPYLVVDTGSASPYKGNVYLSWTYVGSDGVRVLLISRTTNGSVLFDSPGVLSPVDTVGVWNSVMAVAPGGELYLAYEDAHVSPRGISLLKSTDGGRTFRGPRTVATLQPLTLLTGGGGVRGGSAPSMTVDAAGNVHLVWAAAPTGSSVDRADVFYSRSTDGGTTFSSPRRMNDDATSTSQAFAAVAATADGSVAVKWSDRRNDPGNDAVTEVVMAISRDGGATFGRTFRVSDTSWAYGPIETGFDVGYHGDRDALVADGGTFYVGWSDERGADPDVYFAAVPQTFDAQAPDFSLTPRQVRASVKAGGSVAFDVDASTLNGFSGSLALGVSPAVAGLSAQLSSGTVAVGGSVRLTVTASAATPAGTYALTISGTGGGLTRGTTIRVTVYPAARSAALPVNVTRTKGFTAGPGVKADPAGVVHLVYEDDTDSVQASSVFYRRSTDGGATFSDPLKLNAAGTTAANATFAVDGAGRVVVAWTYRGPSDPRDRVLVARSTNGGVSFGAPVAVSPSAILAFAPQVALDRSGNVLLAFYDVAPTVPNVAFTRSTDGGATFGSTTTIQENAASAITHPGLAFDSKGVAYLTYTAQSVSSAGLASIVKLCVAPAGQGFGPPIAATTTQVANAFGPDVAVGPDDSVYLAFYDRFVSSANVVNRDVVVVRSTDGGRTFSTQVNVSSNAGQSYFPSIAVEPAGTVDVVWEDSSGNDGFDVFLSRSTDNGRTFSAPFNVSADPGLSGSFANPFEPPGGSGRSAVSIGAGGTVLVSFADDSDAGSDVLLARLTAAALANNPPTVTITSPRSGAVVDAGVPVTFEGSGSDPDGDALSFTWSFGDGTTANVAAPPARLFAVPGVYTATLTATDARGASAAATVTFTVLTPAVTGASLLIPVVLETPGVGGSRYVSEVTLVSRAETVTDVVLRYTAATGGGSGFARLSLFPNEQRTIPSVISYLRTRGVPIPDDGTGKVGTLLATFAGASPSVVYAGARTFTSDPAGGTGTFGLFYPAAATTTTSATLFGLQQNATQRSNVALVNAGAEPVTLRVSLRGPAGEDLGTLPDQVLPAYGWVQLNQPLLGKATSGRAVVSRVSGSSPFSAYAVLNDAVTSDGSFLPPLLPGDASGGERLVPVVLDVQGLGGARFRTELTLANLTNAPLSLDLVYRAAEGFGSGSGSVPLTLAAGEQRIVPDAVAFLRATLPIEGGGQNVGGSLLVRPVAGTPASALVVGARTFVPASAGGTFGLFYTGLSLDESASGTAYVYGLREDAGQRSNLALVNAGDAGDPIRLRVLYVSAGGSALAAPTELNLRPGEWVQLGRPLAALGATAGYARVERIGGASRFVAYGVLNDNVTSDGSYIPMSR